MLCFTPTSVAPNFTHMETVISLETVVSNMQSSTMSVSEGYYSLLWGVLLVFFKAQLQILWVPLDFFFNFFDFFWLWCNNCNPWSKPCVTLCTAFSHFRHFRATCAFLGTALQDFAGCWGLSACCWQLSHCCLSPWMSSLSQVRPQVMVTHPNITGVWHRPVACWAGGFWFYPL